MDQWIIPWYTPPPLTPELQAVKDAADELLRARGVWDIDSYDGWANLEDPDPASFGYRMWIETPPYDHNVMEWQHNVPPRRAPTAREQTLMELGHDFFGLMKTARHCIGQALLYEPHAKPIEVESGEFDFSEFAALTALIAAADRLRDFVITAMLGKKTDEEGQLEASYQALDAAGFGALATDLRTGFEAAKAARKARNTVVHGLSTVPARVHREFMERDRKAFEEQSWGKEDRGTHGEMIAEWDRHVDAERAKIAARAQLLCDTYVALVTLGDRAFRAEYNVRQRRGSTTS
jgi:hypothetical protein